MKLTKSQVRLLYARWEARSPYLEKALQRAAFSVYPLVLEECTYEWKGERRWMGGADSVSKAIQAAFQNFVEEYERLGRVAFQTFDGVIWATHHNGVLADKFIQCTGEQDAIEFLNSLGGIIRGE